MAWTFGMSEQEHRRKKRETWLGSADRPPTDLTELDVMRQRRSPK
jgi:hypothetical protein